MHKNAFKSFMSACEKNDMLDYVKSTIEKEKNFDFFATDVKFNTPFHKACAAGAERIFEFLFASYVERLKNVADKNFILKNDADKQLYLLNKENTAEKNLFDLALESENLQLAERIFTIVRELAGQKEADDMINRRDSHGATAIRRLCGNVVSDQTKKMEYLLRKGANPFIKDHSGYNALSAVVSRNHVAKNPILSQFNMFVELTDIDWNYLDAFGRNYFFLACECGNADVARRIFEITDTDVNSRNSRKQTPLMVSACEGHEEVVDFLLEKGAKINLKDEDSTTAYIYSCFWGFERIMEKLEKRGAKINGKTRFGNSAIYEPIRNSCYDAVLKLADKGLDLRNMNYDNESPLFTLFDHMEEEEWNDWKDEEETEPCVRLCSELIFRIGLDNLDSYLEYDQKLRKGLEKPEWRYIWDLSKEKAKKKTSIERLKTHVESSVKNNRNKKKEKEDNSDFIFSR